MKRLEKLRQRLYEAIENGEKDNILNTSRELDYEILRYIRVRSRASRLLPRLSRSIE